jgi:hypothetical protein
MAAGVGARSARAAVAGRGLAAAGRSRTHASAGPACRFYGRSGRAAGGERQQAGRHPLRCRCRWLGRHGGRGAVRRAVDPARQWPPQREQRTGHRPRRRGRQAAREAAAGAGVFRCPGRRRSDTGDRRPGAAERGADRDAGHALPADDDYPDRAGDGAAAAGAVGAQARSRGFDHRRRYRERRSQYQAPASRTGLSVRHPRSARHRSRRRDPRRRLHAAGRARRPVALCRHPARRRTGPVRTPCRGHRPVQTRRALRQP